MPILPLRPWNVSKNQPIQTLGGCFGEFLGAIFSKDSQRVLTWDVGVGYPVRLWDFSDYSVPIERRILEHEVRSATTLDESGGTRVLSYDEWLAKRAALAKQSP